MPAKSIKGRKGMNMAELRAPPVTRAVLSLGQEALAHKKGKLSARGLVDAVLAMPATRRCAIKETGLCHTQLRRVIRLAQVNDPCKTFDWPAELFERDNDDSFIAPLPDLENTNPQANDKKAGPLTRRHAVRNLWRNTPTEWWLRTQIVASTAEFDHARGQLKRRLVRRLHGQDKPVDSLLNQLRRTAVVKLQQPEAVPSLICIVSPGSVGVSTVCREMARSFGLKYVSVHPDATGPTDLINDVGSSCAVAEIRLSGTLTPGSAAYVLLAGCTWTDDSTTLSSEASFDTIRKRIYPVVTLVAPIPPSNFESRPVEELVALVREYHRRECRDRYEAAAMPEFVWSLFRSVNTVVFSPASYRGLERQVRKEITVACNDAASESGTKTVVQHMRDLARLLLFSVPRPNPKTVVGLGRDFVERVTRNGSTRRGCRLFVTREVRKRLHELLEPSPEARFRERWTSGRFLTFEVNHIGDDNFVSAPVDRVSLAFGAEALVWEQPQTSQAHVVGCERAKKVLRLAQSYILDPSEFERFEAVAPKFILLVGSPGNGKTMLAREFAARCRATFLCLAAPQVNGQRFAGEGSQLLTRTFEAAHNTAPSIVFIDELDAIGSRVTLRENGEVGFDYRTNINTLLTLIDAIQPNERIIVLGATNAPEALDPALLRHGRFGLQVQIDAPTAAERRQLVLNHLSKRVFPDLSTVVDRIVNHTSGFSCASVVRVVNDAKLRAIAQGESLLREEHIVEAIAEVQHGPRRPYEDSRLRRRTAVHEAGHALVGRMLRPEVVLNQVTLVARTAFLGATQWRPKEDDVIAMTAEQVGKEMTCLLAGPVAEQFIFGDHDSGCVSDFDHAKWLASFQVRYLDARAGARFLFVDEDGPSALADACRQAMQELIDGSMERAKRILEQHKPALLALADQLDHRETLYGPDVDHILRTNGVCGI